MYRNVKSIFYVGLLKNDYVKLISVIYTMLVFQ